MNSKELYFKCNLPIACQVFGCIESFSVIKYPNMVIMMNEVWRVLPVSIPEEKSSMAVEGLRNGRSKSEAGKGFPKREA